MNDIRITSGNPTDEELAALLMVVRLRMQNNQTQEQLPPAWNDARLAMRTQTPVGSDQWRRSSLPG